MHRLASLFLLLVSIAASMPAFAEIAERKVDLYSEGTRVSAIVLYLKEHEGRKLPTVILSHGWGGTAAMLRPQAERFAQAGYFALAIDYRGWGESDARWMRDESAAPGRGARRELREVVHPLDQATDLFSAVHWAMGEPTWMRAASACGAPASPAAWRRTWPRATRASRPSSPRSHGSASAGSR
jgi:hypothetical protein